MHQVFADGSVDGLRVTPYMSLAPEVQASEGLVNASAHVWFQYPRTLLRRHALLNLVRRIGVEPHAARNLVDAGALLGKPTIKMRRQGALVGADAQFMVIVIAEQEPCAESRITLAHRRDRFGLPRAKINWQLTNKMWRTVVRVSKELQGQFRDAD